MDSCEGNWSSRIYWENEAQNTPNKAYAVDGLLHICPFIGTDIQGQQFVTDEENNVTTPYPLTGTTGPLDTGRFSIEYSRDNNDGRTYRYKGTGRVFAPDLTFIYGTVTASIEGDAFETGTWEAVRGEAVSGRKPGSGEEPREVTHNSDSKPT